ncbi:MULTISPECIES: RICIN domain-containing protein [Streptomyces]|uniref:RICIN domain-containing protein n=1 Tax=Streptomyces TaxID=1883 RepID=UPI0012916016|nr:MULTISPECIES: RICIN domain-containing protein [Streptomyces]MCX5040396.1 ricin-type beta-trefoil lectin domain protein [Streptomyces coelicoflavus]QFX80694.1 hydrogenase expression protein [Streptomyces sp. SYP-A7193]
MSLWTSLEPASATVDPGSSTRVRLRVRNTGDVVDEYRFEPVGDVAPWTTVEPQTLRLYPGTTGTVELTFAPPRTPDATAGPNPYAVRITPTEHPDAVTVPEGNLTITSFTEVRAELVPPTVKGRFRGRPRLAVDNLGNTKVTASVAGSDTGDHLSYEIRPSNVQIEPGRAAFVETTLKPKQVIWFGSKEERPYTLAVRRSGVDPTDVEGTYVQRGFLPRWLATFFGIFVALAIAFVMIWIAYKPQVRSSATERTQQAGAALAPSPSASPETLPSSAESAPVEQPQAEQPATREPKDDEGGGGGGEKAPAPGKSEKESSGGGDKEKPEPEAPETVAPGTTIYGHASNRCIEVAGHKWRDGAPLQIADCTGKNWQKWDFRPDGTIRSLGLCMDATWGGTANGTVVQVAVCSGNPAQQFILAGPKDLVNVQANKCVDVVDGKTGNGARLQLWECDGKDDQKWSTR